MCTHLDQIKIDIDPAPPEGCKECIEAGNDGVWFHLRKCLICGHVGCCDSSPGKHASEHFAETGHPIAQSYQPGETWAWCFADDELLLENELVP